MDGAPGDDVTVDPEFRQSNESGLGDGRGPGWLVVAAVIGVALIVSYLLRISAPEISQPTSLPTLGATTLPNTSPGPPTANGSLAPVVEYSGSEMPLGQVLPDFTDVVVALTWNNEGVGVVRWPPEQPGPETVMSFDHSDGSTSRSLDASGEWFSEVRANSALVVHPVRESGSESTWLFEQSGVRVWSPVWHDRRPGRLAWLACEVDAPGSLIRLYTAEVALDAIPESRRHLDIACEDRGVWLARWGDWGMLLHRTGRSGTAHVVTDSEAVQVAEGRLHPKGEWFVGVGPGSSTVWTEGLETAAASSFLLSPDGTYRDSVPGLTPEERLESAQVSPDGSSLALVLDLVAYYGSLVRIVDTSTGFVVAEIAQPSSWVNGMTWSSDGRFLVYQRWPDVTSNRAGLPRDVELVFYDTEASAGVAFPFSGVASLLRSSG